jgi:hypothetical protein
VREDIAAALIESFEKKAGEEPIIAAALITGNRHPGEDTGFPRGPIPWKEACEYIEAAGDDYDAPTCIAWTETRVLMPVSHEMGRRHGVWCITAPRDPRAHAFPTIYDCNDPGTS